jgi:hypothetical protein
MRAYLGPGAVIVALTCAFHTAAIAATVRSTISKENKTIVSIIGEIAHGDADALKGAIKSANDSGRLVSGIRLNSPGGNLLEGSKLAEIVRFGKIATVIPDGAQCASACFIVFAAGDPKFVSYSAFVGVHGASDENGQETVAAGAATVSMARIVKDLGVPAPIIGKMVVTPPDQIVWLTPDDLRSMGATMTGKPEQIPPNQSAGSQPPMQLAPNVRANAPTSDDKQAPTWKELIAMAFSKSAEQNNGKPQFSRACQPEIKLCSSAVFFKAEDGTDMMLRTAEDSDGKLIDRDICKFNEFGDIRLCTDWDTGATIREMKNTNGDWIKVGNN